MTGTTSQGMYDYIAVSPAFFLPDRLPLWAPSLVFVAHRRNVAGAVLCGVIVGLLTCMCNYRLN